MRRSKRVKSKNIRFYIIYSLAGLLVLASGVVLNKFTRDTKGIMLTLPYVLIGIGCGIFGYNFGTAMNIYIAKKNPKLAKQMEIEQKDERNICILNKAKAKSYDLMIIVFGALIVTFALIQVDFRVIIGIIATYLFIIFSNIYFTVKWQKEM